MSQKRIIILSCSALFLCLSGLICYSMNSQTKKEENWIDATSSVAMDTSTMNNQDLDAIEEIDSSDEEKKDELIKVYICGAVNKPGVYELSSNERLVDLLELCDGFREDADSNCVNLATYLEDGEKVYIMTKEESENSDKIKEESKKEELDGRLNINIATLEELMTLPGIGKTKAERIIEYREKTANFASIEDIMKIDGIKDCVYKKIKDLIRI